MKIVTSKPNRAMREKLRTNQGMTRFMNELFGKHAWCYDTREDVWIAPKPDAKGPDREFYVVQRGGKWFVAKPPIMN